MKLVIDYLLKLVQIVIMPVLLKILDNVFKYFHEKYKKDEEFKKRVDSVMRGIAAKVDPVKIMQMFMEYKTKASAREAEKKAETRQNKAGAVEDDALDPQRAAANKTAAEQTDEADLAGTAAETARLSYEASKRASRRAAGWVNRWGRRAGDWLREETGLNDDDASPVPGNGTEEGREIDRLKRKLQEDEKRKAQQAPEQPPEKSDAPTPPPAPISTRPGEKKPKQQSGRTEDTNEGSPADTEKDGSEIGYADELKELIRKERENRNSSE